MWRAKVKTWLEVSVRESGSLLYNIYINIISSYSLYKYIYISRLCLRIVVKIIGNLGNECRTYGLLTISVVDPKLFFPDPDPTLTLILDPDPACL